MNWSLEEGLAYEFAQHWREEIYHPNLAKVDWLRFANLLTHNRMGVLACKSTVQCIYSVRCPQALREQAKNTNARA
jgi:hypothetical protein